MSDKTEILVAVEKIDSLRPYFSDISRHASPAVIIQAAVNKILNIEDGVKDLRGCFPASNGWSAEKTINAAMHSIKHLRSLIDKKEEEERDEEKNEERDEFERQLEKRVMEDKYNALVDAYKEVARSSVSELITLRLSLASIFGDPTMTDKQIIERASSSFSQ